MSTAFRKKRAHQSVEMSTRQFSIAQTDGRSEDTEQPPEVSLLGDVMAIFIITFTSAYAGYFATNFETHSLLQPRMEPWLLARASGITAYVLMWLLAMAGIVLSHPLRQRFKFLHPVTRMRLHTLLAIFTLSFITLHIMSVVLDSYANVGISGAFIPFFSKYRTVPVGLGTLGLYAGLITGITARFRIKIAKRGWTSIHRFSIISVILIWIHAVYAGTDSRSLALIYLISALLLIALALSRYLPSTPIKAAPVK